MLKKDGSIVLKLLRGELTPRSPSRLPVSFSVHNGGIFLYILVATYTEVPAGFRLVDNLYPSLVIQTVAQVTRTDDPVPVVVVITVIKHFQMSRFYQTSIKAS